MKNHVVRSFIGLSLMAFTFLGCDLFDKVDDVTLDIEISHTFVIDEDFDSDGDPVPYSDVGIIDATKDADFEKYKDKIKEVTVHQITYTVENYAGDPTISFLNGMGNFYASSGQANAIATAGISFQNIQSSVGQTFTLQYTTQGLEAIAQQLESVHAVTFEVAGTLSETPVAFNVPVTIHATIKAEALD